MLFPWFPPSRAGDPQNRCERCEQMPGVCWSCIMEHRSALSHGSATTTRPTASAFGFEDDVVRHWGQHVAVVIAEPWNRPLRCCRSQSRIRAQALTCVRVSTTTPERASLSPSAAIRCGLCLGAGQSRPDLHHPQRNHNPIELHASVAVWMATGSRSTNLARRRQSSCGHGQVLAFPLKTFACDAFLGSGFGGKLFPWPHTAMAAVAARA